MSAEALGGANELVDLTVRPRSKILLVDDQPINIQVLHQAFAADHDVCMATSGAQALAVCSSQQPDLILLDIEMPAMDGFEVCRRLKADPSTRDIPVIFVTAHVDDATQVFGLELGAVDFISKPINLKIVRARVNIHLTLKYQSDLLRRFAYIDGLTGVHNRRYFDERLINEWGRAARNSTAISLLLLDVDFFKRYNDHYGHQAGDDCLRRVAAGLASGLKRPADMLARYGGEEFVCLLPDTDLSGALQLAEQLGAQIAALQIAHADSAVGGYVTVSLGVCTKPAGVTGGSVVELLRQADVQLYKAKQGGRNRSCAAQFVSES
jgi:diguanylate cyclase (GGDEF)-like protein